MIACNLRSACVTVVVSNKLQHQNDKRLESLMKWSLRRLIVRKNAHDDFRAVDEGLVEVTNDHVSIVTNMAIPADRIEEAAAEEARHRALERLREKISFEEDATLNASLAC